MGYTDPQENSKQMNRALKLINKDNDIKGFILLELIIVLLIIVILLAILIPLVTQNIDDAKESAELSEARAVKVAMQTIINEDYMDDDLDEFIVLVDHENYGLSKEGKKEVERLLNLDVGKADNINVDDNHILRSFSYFTVNGSKINYEGDKYTTEYIY